MSAMYMKWGAQTFSSIFGVITIFDCNFAKIVVTPSNWNENSLVLLKDFRKIGETASKLTHKP